MSVRSAKKTASVRTANPTSASVATAVAGAPSARSCVGGECKNPVEGVQQAIADLIAYLHEPHGALYDDNATKFEAASGAKREHAVFGLVGLTALYLIFGKSAAYVSNLIAFIYPANRSLKASKNRDIGEAVPLLIYWSIFAALVSIIDNIFGALPLYFLLRSVFLVFLYLPQTDGAQLFNSKVVIPVSNLVGSLFDKAKGQ